MSGRWRATIHVSGKMVSLGLHDSEFEAAKAYDRAVLAYFGSRAFRNFP